MGDGGDDLVLGEGLHGRALVLGELALLLVAEVRAGGDGALDGVEGDLAVLGGDGVEPVLGATGVLGAVGQGEGVGQEVEDAVGARDREVDVVLTGLLPGGVEAGHGPVAHDVEGGLAVHDGLHGGLPVLGVKGGVGEAHDGLVVPQRLGDLSAAPVGLACEEPVVGVYAQVGDEDGLEQLELGPGHAHGDGGQAGGLDLLHVGDPGVDGGGGLGRVEPGGLERGHRGPHDVGPVDVGGHGVDLAVGVLEAVHEGGREGLVELELLVEVGHVQQVAGLDVVLDLGAGVGLVGVRRVLGGQVGGELLLGLAAGAAGDGLVLELRLGELLVEDLDQGIQTKLLRAGRPPGDDVDLAGVPLTGGSTGLRTGAAGGGTGGQGGGDCSGSQPCQHGAAGEIVGGTHGTAP